MTDFLALWHSPTTLVFLIGSAALIVVWRLSNQKISLTWESKTVAPEPSKADAARQAAEIAIARAQADEEIAVSLMKRTPTIVYEERKP